MSSNAHPAGGTGLMLSAVLRAGDQLADVLGGGSPEQWAEGSPAAIALAAWSKATNQPERAAR